MFIRRKSNKSGSTSIQILEKRAGRNVLIKSIGSARDERQIQSLLNKARKHLKGLNPQESFNFQSAKDKAINEFLSLEVSPRVTSVGPELVLGKIFDRIGFNKIKAELFKDIVLSRLTYPVSKLKTTEYLLHHKNQLIEVSKIYRFLDKLHREFKPIVEQVAYNYTKERVGDISVVFYDMTTLYFEAEDEDELRKIGFSKDGKFQKPQIMLGLLVAENAYPIGYDIFEGNTFEGKTLLPVIKKIQAKYGFPKPVVIADSGLLSKDNLSNLEQQDYRFIIGARIKNEAAEIQKSIIGKAKKLKDGEYFVIEKNKQLRLIISYSKKRATKDAANREKGLKRLLSQLKTGKLTKQHINNRGYNKFLTLESPVKVSINQQKVLEDAQWDGLKGYVTNSNLTPEKVIQNYKCLWQIEKAFRISKTDLKIRPIFHRKKDRIEAHICIAFVAYTVYKELERVLLKNNIQLSPTKAIELVKTIYQIEYTLPDSQEILCKFARLIPEQETLLKI